MFIKTTAVLNFVILCRILPLCPLTVIGLSSPSPRRITNKPLDRRYAIQRMTGWNCILWFCSGQSVYAKTIIKPDNAFRSLVKSRQELDTINKTYLIRQDYDGMRDYLSDPSLNINSYEENATALLTSKQLDAESKMAIGTIRRYGVGADVIISYGGLKAELEEYDMINGEKIRKALQRTIDSLDEVIAICKSNGFEA